VEEEAVEDVAKYFSYSEAVDPDKPAATLKALGN